VCNCNQKIRNLRGTGVKASARMGTAPKKKGREFPTKPADRFGKGGANELLEKKCSNLTNNAKCGPRRKGKEAESAL